MQTISVTELAALWPGVQIIDVREVDEFRGAHIEGAANVPLSGFMENYRSIELESPVYLLCHAGVRSAQATQYLTQQGFDAVNIEGGIAAWHQAGNPVVLGEA